MNIILNLRNFKKSIFLFSTLFNLFPYSLALSVDDIKNTKRVAEDPTAKYKLVLAKREFNKEEIEIESQMQSEDNNILYAKGNVSAIYKNFILKSDNLTYDKTNKVLIAEGNISLIIGKQIFKMTSFEYNFKNKKGFLLNVNGFINTDNLIDDLYENLMNQILKQFKF